MVCDGAMIASTIVSMMTNGVCCMWQHQEEMDRRETIRRDIRVEYWQQRLIDHELMMAQYQEQQDRRHEGQHHLALSTTTAVGLRGDPTRARLYSDSSTSGFLEEQTADERRKQLLMDKRRASSDNRRIQQQQEDRRVSPGSVTQREQPTVSNKSNERLPPVSLVVKPRRQATSPRVEATDYRWRDECSKASPVTLEDMGRTSSRACSLVDSDDEDDEDNFMDIPLR